MVCGWCFLLVFDVLSAYGLLCDWCLGVGVFYARVSGCWWLLLLEKYTCVLSMVVIVIVYLVVMSYIITLGFYMWVFKVYVLVSCYFGHFLDEWICVWIWGF